MTGAYIEKPSLDHKRDMDLKDPENAPTADGEEPTEHERASLRRIGENLPASTFLIAIVELTERFTYYGAQGLFQNYITNSKDGSDGAKGLGLGHQAAYGINTFFQWFCYGTCAKRCGGMVMVANKLQ